MRELEVKNFCIFSVISNMVSFQIIEFPWDRSPVLNSFFVNLATYSLNLLSISGRRYFTYLQSLGR